MRIAARGAVIGGSWIAGDVETDGGMLTRVGLESTGSSIILPGLIDLHVCGYAGADFNTADAEAIATARRALLRDGVFCFQPTVITDSEDVMVAQVGVLGVAAQDDATGAQIMGVHAEGPFLSADYRGVHHPEHLHFPNVGFVRRLLAAGPLTTLTLAPELAGAMDFIDWAAARGLTVQLGHTGAEVATAHEAFDRGARGVTHLFNGMAAFHHRQSNVAAVSLSRPDVAIQLIADDVHTSREVSLAALAAAEDRTMLVTDSTSAAGGGDGDLTIAGLAVTVVDGVPRLVDGTLAGSTVTLFEQVARLVRRGWAPDRAVNLASRNPARYAGIPGGVLRAGGPADLLVADADLRLERVLLAGVDQR